MLYFELENELKFYNLGAKCLLFEDVYKVQTVGHSSMDMFP